MGPPRGKGKGRGRGRGGAAARGGGGRDRSTYDGFGTSDVPDSAIDQHLDSDEDDGALGPARGARGSQEADFCCAGRGRRRARQGRSGADRDVGALEACKRVRGRR